MHKLFKEADRDELSELRCRDPEQLVAAYREVANMAADETLPPDVTFPRMIDAILEHGSDRPGHQPRKDRWR